VAVVSFSLAITTVVLLLASIYAIPSAICRLMNRCRRRFSTRDLVERPTAVVLLSGRVEFHSSSYAGPSFGSGAHPSDTIPTPAPGADRAVLSASCDARVREAVRVYEQIAPELVISTGGIPRPTCAELMKARLVELGVPAGRILLEDRSRTTRDEAVFVAEILKKEGARQSVLVTSDVHMPRALGAFRVAGVQPVPAAAADPGERRPWTARIAPSREGLRFSGDLVHELLGLLWYRLRGWA
jgi:uncharacterized SAM-binding protein YcdF (DUF218 family)